MSAKYNVIREYYIKMKTFGPLHIENEGGELLFSEDNGMSMIGATSIAGAFREYARETLGADGKSSLENLFGAGGGKSQKSKIVFTNALAIRRQVGTRPHININNQTGSIQMLNGRGQYFDRDYIESGMEFDFEIRLYLRDDRETILEKCLKALDAGIIKIGGLKNSGSGRFTLVSAKKKTWNLKNKGFVAYIKAAGSEKQEILAEIRKLPVDDNFIRIAMDFATQSPLLIKGLPEAVLSEEKLPDSVAMKNGIGQYIIPGSSLKGLFRSQCQKIVDAVGHDRQMIIEIFGSEKKEHLLEDDELKCGRLSFNDVVLENVNDQVTYTRNRIDKFTGGVKETALLTEKPVKARGRMEMVLKKGENCAAQIGLILFVLRDLAVGEVALGSHQGIGRGRIVGEKIMIDNEIVIDFTQANIQSSEKLKQYVTALIGGETV
jgi:CRISPR/Cas system CSM-associated protein Csm3 (group 7 of RAMP superfamily)